MKIGILAPRLSRSDGVGVHTLRTLEALADRGVSLEVVGAEDCPANMGLLIKARILPGAIPRPTWFHTKLFGVRRRASYLLRDCAHIHSFSESYASLARQLRQKWMEEWFFWGRA